MVKILTDANFETETKNGVVLVDFWATSMRTLPHAITNHR